jgi:hypothetical protein
MAVIEAISTTYLESDVTSVTFSSIPSTYRHLQLRVSAKDTSTGNYGVLFITLNGDTGSDYSHAFIYVYGSTVKCGFEANLTKAKAYGITARMSGSAYHEAEVFGAAVVDILDYSDTNKKTTFSYDAGTMCSDTGNIPFFNAFGCSTYHDSGEAAISTIKIAQATAGQYMVRGSVFTLYGIKDSN